MNDLGTVDGDRERKLLKATPGLHTRAQRAEPVGAEARELTSI